MKEAINTKHRASTDPRQTQFEHQKTGNKLAAPGGLLHLEVKLVIAPGSATDWTTEKFRNITLISFMSKINID